MRLGLALFRRQARYKPNMHRLILAACFLAALGLPAIADDQVPASARLRQLQRELGTNEGRAIEAFWRERQSAAAPLIEHLDGTDGKVVLVTFLWRGNAATENVFVIALDQVQFANAAYFERGRMARLGETDVWYRSYRMPCDLRFSYRFSVNDPGTPAVATSSEATARRMAQLRPDPLNPIHYASRSGDSSVAELPCAAPQPESKERDGIAHGEVRSEVFAGKSGERHALQIYVPPGAGSRRSMALVVLIGGQFAPEFPVPAILDNLIAERRIGPTIAVSIGFADMAAYVKASQSDEGFAHEVAKELLPWLRARFPISDDPRRVVIAGASAPGAGALFVAMRSPELFGNVLTQAGGYAYPHPAAPDELIPVAHPDAELLARELASRPALPLRVFLGVGTMDDVPWEGKDPRHGYATVLVSARHLRDVLEARGYCFAYREFGGGHEALAWRGTFAEGIAWLLGKDACAPHRRTAP